MAKKSKGIRGLGNLKMGAIGDVAPSAIGTGAGAGTTLALYALVPATPGTINEKVHKFAPFIGTVVGGAAAIGVLVAGARPTQAVATFLHALVGAGIVYFARRMFFVEGAVAGASAGAEGIRGLGNVVVPQLGNLGATVLQEVRGLKGNNQDQGHVVQLRGTVQSGAFGVKAYD